MGEKDIKRPESAHHRPSRILSFSHLIWAISFSAGTYQGPEDICELRVTQLAWTMPILHHLPLSMA
jgi:hypothetical protein